VHGLTPIAGIHSPPQVAKTVGGVTEEKERLDLAHWHPTAGANPTSSILKGPGRRPPRLMGRGNRSVVFPEAASKDLISASPPSALLEE
jgi:hypothetical protein